MKMSGEQNTIRDRTYKRVDSGVLLSDKQYLTVIILLLVTHSCLEVLYVWLGVTPMAIINIGSILVYFVCIFLIQKKKYLMVIWTVMFEIYLHVIFAVSFMGMACGFQLWLYGTLTSIFLPFFITELSESPRRQIAIFSVMIIATFHILTTLNRFGFLPQHYYIDPAIAGLLYYINATLGFASIMLYIYLFFNGTTARRLELQRVADHDFLTGIFNRQRMQKIIDAEIEIEQDLPENHLNVAMVDIDFFKKINDTYGHDAGDIALIELANIFTSYEDTGLLYGRWGGEEFLLIAPESMSYNEFGKMLEGIRQQVENNEFSAGDKTIKYTISIGASSYKKGMTSEQLIDAADERLYHAKETGRNKVVY